MPAEANCTQGIIPEPTPESGEERSSPEASAASDDAGQQLKKLRKDGAIRIGTEFILNDECLLQFTERARLEDNTFFRDLGLAYSWTEIKDAIKEFAVLHPHKVSTLSILSAYFLHPDYQKFHRK